MSVPNFWKWMARKYHALDAYKTFLKDKQRFNENSCFQCKENTCCVFLDIRGDDRYVKMLVIAFNTIHPSYVNKTERNRGYTKLCAALTKDFMCSIEEAKPSNCLFHRCRELPFATDRAKRWYDFVNLLKEHQILHRETVMIGPREKTVERGVFFDGWLHLHRLEWVELHPEYPDIVRERLLLQRVLAI